MLHLDTVVHSLKQRGKEAKKMIVSESQAKLYVIQRGKKAPAINKWAHCISVSHRPRQLDRMGCFPKSSVP